MIPRTAHFVWIGRNFPWTNVLAIKSAVSRGGFDNLVLHHTDDLSESCWWNELESMPCFNARRFDPEDYLADCENGRALIDLYGRLTKPAAKSDILRTAILAKEGGVYLDLDTVTVASFEPLCEEAGFFCGSERIAWPAFILHSKNPLKKAKSVALDVLRYGFRAAPGGWRGFRRVENLYFVAVCPGIMAGRRRHPILIEMLQKMTKVPREQENNWAAIGPHLLQALIHDHVYDDVKVHPPELFYPLPTEISRHWFRRCKDPNIDDVLYENTRVVHWYASVSNREMVQRMSPAFVQQNVDRQLFSALAYPFVESNVAELQRGTLGGPCPSRSQPVTARGL